MSTAIQSIMGVDSGFPYIESTPRQTPNGTPYLVAPGIHLVSKPNVNFSSLQSLLDGFDPSLKFSDYLGDPVRLSPGAWLCKVAGQICYASFGPKRSWNEKASTYLDNIKSQKHGSVLEHANFSFVIYGVSRSLTHELVRHRAGFAFSQLSQRYVSGRVLRFVQRPEYRTTEGLHLRFVQRSERNAADYEDVAAELMALQKEGEGILSADARTDLRKKVQQTARSVLPNETETIVVATANVRAWRHFIEMRANEHAEVEIRALAFGVYQCLVTVEPMLFGDYEVLNLNDGTNAVRTDYPKV